MSSTLRLCSRTRVHGVVVHSTVDATVPAILTAVDGLREQVQALRSGVDSAAALWLQIDERRLDEADIAAIAMAASDGEREAEARALLTAAA